MRKLSNHVYGKDFSNCIALLLLASDTKCPRISTNPFRHKFPSFWPTQTMPPLVATVLHRRSGAFGYTHGRKSRLCGRVRHFLASYPLACWLVQSPGASLLLFGFQLSAK